jgi:hypothetical protein
MKLTKEIILRTQEFVDLLQEDTLWAFRGREIWPGEGQDKMPEAPYLASKMSVKFAGQMDSHLVTQSLCLRFVDSIGGQWASLYSEVGSDTEKCID